MNWTQINNKRKKHVRYGERVFGRMFQIIRSQIADILRRVETIGEVEGVMDGLVFDEDIDYAFDVFYRRVGVDFARSTYKSLKGYDDRELKEDITQLERMWEQYMAAFVAEKAGPKIESVRRTLLATYRREIDRAVQQGLDEGWGVDKIGREILRQGRRTEKWQAMRIARTEVLSASNYGSAQGAEATGEPLVKEWLISPSPDQREDHLAMVGTTIDYEQHFILPTGERLFLPGDPEGALEEIINCRCGVSFKPKEDRISQILES